MSGTVAYGEQEALQLSHRLNWNRSVTGDWFRSSYFTGRETKKLYSFKDATAICYRQPYFLYEHTLQDIEDSYTNFHEAMVPHASNYNL